MQTPISRSPFNADCYSTRGLEFNVVKQMLSRDYERKYTEEAEKTCRNSVSLSSFLSFFMWQFRG